LNPALSAREDLPEAETEMLVFARLVCDVFTAREDVECCCPEFFVAVRHDVLIVKHIVL
jgi:hypothetical protein